MKLNPTTTFSIQTNDSFNNWVTSQDIHSITEFIEPSTHFDVMSSNPIKLIEFSNSDAANAAFDSLSGKPWVDYAEIDEFITIQESPVIVNSQEYQLEPASLIDTLSQSNETIVAVIDSGIDHEHSNLKNQFHINRQEEQNKIDDDNNGLVDDVFGYNFYNYTHPESRQTLTDHVQHGTHIAGIIAAKKHSPSHISGINDNSKIITISFFDRFGRGFQFDAARSIYYAVERGAKVINCSWGFTFNSRTLKKAIDYAADKGIIIVAAAGNSKNTLNHYPAAYQNVISVNSVNSNNELSDFSSYGNSIDFTEIGENIYSTLPNERYGSLSGTSQSTAIVTGIITKVLNAYPQLNHQQLMSYLIASTDDLHEPGKDSYSGYGRINTTKLYYSLSTQSENLQPNQTNGIRNIFNYPNPMKSSGTSFGFDTDSVQSNIEVQIVDLAGQLIKTLSKTSSRIGHDSLFWDGSDNNNQAVNNGSYYYIFKIDGNIHRRAVVSVLR